MRIIQLVETLEVGGLERMAVDLSLSLRAAGHTVGVYCLFGAGPLRSELESAGIPVTEFHKERTFKLALLRAMTRQLRRDQPDVLHGHNPGVHHFAAISKWAAGVPVCVNTRHSATSSTGAPYQERYFRWVERLTDHVIFDCNYVRKHLEDRMRYPAAKCSVILNGIPYDRFLKRPAEPGSVRPRLRIGTVGRLVPAKGHAVLIEAFSQVAAELPEANLQIYGYGVLEEELRAQVRRLGMEQRIELAGRTDDAARVFESLDIFVLSSLNEGLPLVILEAMAAGLPIVSTRVGGVPEVAPEQVCAWYCEPGSVDGLAAALRMAAASADLAAAGGAARRHVIAHCGLAQMAQHYEELYKRLLENRRA